MNSKSGETRVETTKPSEHNPADPLHMQFPLYYQHAAQKQAPWKHRNIIILYQFFKIKNKRKKVPR